MTPATRRSIPITNRANPSRNTTVRIARPGKSRKTNAKPIEISPTAIAKPRYHKGSLTADTGIS
ncbi:MAG: hypothetical protein WBW40_00740, partial [Thermoplasmata archaeon]